MSEVVRHKDALARGFIRYFTGKACKRGHIAGRWASTRACVECVRLRDQTSARKKYFREYDRRRAER